jgi:hypothetical protein
MFTTDNFEVTPFFAEYLQETHHNIKPFSAAAWLAWLDEDSLNMLDGYVDNFHDETPEDEVDENEVIDFYQLVEGIIELETDKKEFEEDYPDHAECAQYLCVMTTLELLRRKGLAKIKGDGKITGKDTTYTLTELGQKTGEVL